MKENTKSKWGTPGSMKAELLRKWRGGRLLGDFESDAGGIFPLKVSIKGPTTDERKSRYKDVVDWLQLWRENENSSPRWQIVKREVKDRMLGVVIYPDKLIIETLDDLAHIINKGGELNALRKFKSLALNNVPESLPLLYRRNLRLLEVGEADWLSILRLAKWLHLNPSSGIYYRELPLDDTDTKFVERRFSIVEEVVRLIRNPITIDNATSTILDDGSARPMMDDGAVDSMGNDEVLPKDGCVAKSMEDMDVPPMYGVDDGPMNHTEVGTSDIDNVEPKDDGDVGSPESMESRSGGLEGFVMRQGFKRKPMFIRFRMLDPELSLTRAGVDEDITLRVDALANMEEFFAPIKTVFVTENEINFLAFPMREKSMVIFGKGYGFENMRSVPWLKEKRMVYWGDLDTHGFAILNQFRHSFPEAQSILMDRETIEANLRFAVKEGKQVVANLDRLTQKELAAYNVLKSNSLGKAIRIEQERLPFELLLKALSKI